jgi:hypothetical protein
MRTVHSTAAQVSNRSGTCTISMRACSGFADAGSSRERPSDRHQATAIRQADSSFFMIPSW